MKVKALLNKFIKWILITLGIGLLTNKVYYNYFEAPELSYKQYTSPVLNNTSRINANIKLLVNGETVNSLYITTFQIQNSGGTALQRNNFEAEINPLKISGSSIKDVFVDEFNTNNNSKVLIKQVGDDYYVQFEWMNPGNIIYISVLHERLSENIKLSGGFKDVDNVVRQSNKLEKIKIVEKVSLIAILILITVLFVLTIWGNYCMSTEKRCALTLIKYKTNLSHTKLKEIEKEIHSVKDMKSIDDIVNKYCLKVMKHD